MILLSTFSYFIYNKLFNNRNKELNIVRIKHENKKFIK